MEAAFGAIRDEFGMPTPWAEHEFIMTQEESKDKDDFVTLKIDTSPVKWLKKDGLIAFFCHRVHRVNENKL